MVMVLAPSALRPLIKLRYGARNTRKVDAPVIEKVLVLDGRHGVVENLRALLVGHQYAALQRETSDHLPVIGIDFGHYVRSVGLKSADFGQVACVNKQQAAARAKRDRAQ